MKKVLLLLALLPVMAFGKVAKQYDWYRVIKGWTFPGFWFDYPLHPGDKIYVYYTHHTIKGWVNIAVFDSNGRYLDYYWQGGKDSHLTNPEYCTFLENRKDNRYK